MTSLTRNELLEQILDVTYEMRNNSTVSGYGGIGVDAEVAIGTVAATPITITGFDTETIATPRGVDYDLANDAIIVNRAGVWTLFIKVSLEFDELNAGRKLSLRFYNLDAANPGDSIFRYFVGRNQGGLNMAIAVPFDLITASIGDRMQIQILSENDTFTNVVNIGSTFSVTNNSSFAG